MEALDNEQVASELGSVAGCGWRYDFGFCVAWW